MFSRFVPDPTGDAGSPQRPVPPCGCDQDPVEGLKQLFVDYAQGVALARGRDPATRPVFLRLHGVAHGRFASAPTFPQTCASGCSARGPSTPSGSGSPATSSPGAPTSRAPPGSASSCSGSRARSSSPDQDAPTHDFLLQNHDVFFVDTAKDMCEFTCLSLNGRFDEYVEGPPGHRADPRTTWRRWSTPSWARRTGAACPSRFGDGRYVKYKLEPEVVPGGNGESPTIADPFYLRADLTPG